MKIVLSQGWMADALVGLATAQTCKVAVDYRANNHINAPENVPLLRKGAWLYWTEEEDVQLIDVPSTEWLDEFVAPIMEHGRGPASLVWPHENDQRRYPYPRLEIF